MRLVTAAAFLHRFRAHHRNPPVLGLFTKALQMLEFIPVLDSPDCIPPEGFSLRVCDDDDVDLWSILRCLHKRVLIFSWKKREILVFDQVCGDRRTVAVPPEFFGVGWFPVAVNGAVHCAAHDDPGHVHWSCHRTPFKVVLIGTRIHQPAFVRMYSSETGIWGDLVSATEPWTGHVVTHVPCNLVGNSLYCWLTVTGDGILKFDLDSHSLTIIKKHEYADIHSGCSRIIARDGGVGLIVFMHPSFEIRDCINFDRVATCALHETFDIHETFDMSLLIFDPSMSVAAIVGYSEDIDVVFVSVKENLFSVSVVSMKPTKFCGNFLDNSYHPFTKFYSAGQPLLQLPADEN